MSVSECEDVPVNDRPNVFRYATKELSQDAVICWLIDWAGQPKTEDASLRRCGREFVQALFDAWGDEYAMTLGDSVCTEVLQQEQKIDVLARVNGQHVLLIEDKTGTAAHGEQLERYWEAVHGGKTPFGKVDDEYLYPIFFKTGNQGLGTEWRIQSKGYAFFGRRDFLKVLERYDGDNQILVDFRAYLRGLEERTNQYASWTADSRRLDPLAWEGLYRRLQECFLAPRGRIAWDDVENRLFGGFTGLWWRPTSVDDAASLWLEGKDGNAVLLFRLEVSDGRRIGTQQRRWNEALLAAGGPLVVKPNWMRRGRLMAVAQWAGDVLAYGADGTLDVEATIRILRRAEKVLREASRRVSETDR